MVASELCDCVRPVIKESELIGFTLGCPSLVSLVLAVCYKVSLVSPLSLFSQMFTVYAVQGLNGEFEPGKFQYSTQILFHQLFLLRVYWNPKYRQGPNLACLAFHGHSVDSVSGQGPQSNRRHRCPTHSVGPEDEWSSVSCWQEGLWKTYLNKDCWRSPSTGEIVSTWVLHYEKVVAFKVFKLL